MSGAIAVQMEVGVVAIGPLSNIGFFLLLALSGYAFYRVGLLLSV